MTPEAVAQREAPPSPEVKPSPALAARLYYGEFDPQKPLTKEGKAAPFTDALTALSNQNLAIRKADEAKFADSYKGPAEEMHHNQMTKWSTHTFLYMGHDLKTRGEPVAKIFREKLHFDLGDRVEDETAILRQLYDSESQTEGSFYKEFAEVI